MPLGRKHLRRSRDAPTGGIGRKKNHFQTKLLEIGSQRIGCWAWHSVPRWGFIRRQKPDVAFRSAKHIFYSILFMLFYVCWTIPLQGGSL